MRLNNIRIVGKDCTGCSLCSNICPHRAIHMKPDSEGFLIPYISDACTNCGLCVKYCPSTHKAGRNSCTVGYIAVTKSKKIYKKAASGGIFTTIARTFLNQNPGALVCGAAYLDEKVQHILINNPENLQLLQNSRYVQSDITKVLPQIRQYLLNRKNVLFCGTPCQVAAVKAFTKKCNDKLITLDLVCHGVPSPMFLKWDINTYYGKVHDIVFRWKCRLYSGSTYFLLINKYPKIQSIISSNSDPYFKTFMSNSSFRESCYNCQYANLNREGDITLGDCHISKDYPNLRPGLAKSAVLINSKQGEDVWDMCKSEIDSDFLDIKKEAQINTQLLHPSSRPNERDFIYQDMMSMDAKDFRTKYGRHDHKLKNMILSIINLLPKKF